MAAFALLLAAAAAPPGLCELHARGAWDELLRVGTVDSERFRRDLIKTGRGRAVCELAAEFFGSPAVRRRTAGDGFGAVTAADLFAGIGGTAGGDPAADFAPFAGRWFGRWDGNRVDHHWTATAPLDPPRVYELPGGPVRLFAVQYAWVGDGYGVNLSAGRGDERFLLGYVVHVRDRALRVETARRAHVGVAQPGGGLCWVTPGGVYFERAFRDAAGADRYAITGFESVGEGTDLTIRRAFRAVYTRDPADRPAWESFGWRAE